jgi:hypothetical protein
MKAVRAMAMMAPLLGVSACSWVFGWDGLGDGCRGNCDDAGDAGALVDVSGDVAAGGLCAAPHALCDDFENGDVPDLSRWTTVEQKGTATVSRVTDDKRPNTKAYRAELTGRSSPFVMLVKAVQLVPTKVVCDFELLSDPDDGRRGVFTNVVIQVHPTDGTLDDYDLEWSTAPETYRLTEFWRPAGSIPDGTSFPDLPSPVLRVWQHIRLELSTTAPRPTLQFSYNGGSVGTAYLTHFPVSYDVVRLKFGAINDMNDPGGRVTFDDIVCDFTP